MARVLVAAESECRTRFADSGIGKRLGTAALGLASRIRLSMRCTDPAGTKPAYPFPPYLQTFPLSIECFSGAIANQEAPGRNPELSEAGWTSWMAFFNLTGSGVANDWRFPARKLNALTHLSKPLPDRFPTHAAPARMRLSTSQSTGGE